MRFVAFADPQGHAAPVAAILQAAKRIEGADVVCLGNAVGAGPEPGETVARLRKGRVHLVRGPRDAAALGLPAPQDLQAEGRQNAARLERAETAYLREATPPRRLVAGGRRLLLTSDPAPDPGQADVVLHPGPRALARRVDGRLDVSVGRADDPSGEAPFVVLDVDTGEAEVRHAVWTLGGTTRQL